MKFDLKEKNKLLKDMNLFGYFDKDEIETFIDEEYLDAKLINNVGSYLSKFEKKKLDCNKIVHNYIMNINDIQTLVRHEMNKSIINSKNILDQYTEFAKINDVTINKKQILSAVLKWHNMLYDLGGILELPCLHVILNDEVVDGYDEQIYNIMLDIINKKT